jgi:hypothetical protein
MMNIYEHYQSCSKVLITYEEPLVKHNAMTIATKTCTMVIVSTCKHPELTSCKLSLECK